jgi:hypothetical protein
MLFVEGISVDVVKGLVWGCEGKTVSSLTTASTAACEWWSSGLAAREQTLRACLLPPPPGGSAPDTADRPSSRSHWPDVDLSTAGTLVTLNQLLRAISYTLFKLAVALIRSLPCLRISEHLMVTVAEYGQAIGTGRGQRCTSAQAL